MKPTFNFIFTLLAACLLTFTACQPTATAPDLTQIKADIQAAENAWAAALNTRDLDALLALYTPDAISMPGNSPVLKGKEAIRKQQEQDFANNPAGITSSFEVLEVYADGNTVTEIGLSTNKDASGKVTGTGKYMVLWEKQGDKYLCAREIYNSDAAPAPAASKSIHLFDFPAGVTEAEWSAALTEMNTVIAGMGYPNSGYFFYKSENADDKNYRYYFEGIWPSEEAYQKIHANPAYVAASQKMKPLYEKIKAVEMYRRMNRVH